MGAIAAGIGAAGAVAAAGINTLGKSGGGSSSSGSVAPWYPQQQPIQNGISQAQGVYAMRQGEGPYTGQMVAGSNPYTDNAVQYGTEFANQGNTVGNGLFATGSGLSSAAQPYVNNAANMAQNGIAGPNQGLSNTLQGYGTGAQTIQGASSGLSGSLNQAAINGAQGLQGFQNTLSQAANQGLANPTQQIEQNAQAYANSPQVQASLTATNNAINQTLNQQTLPTQNQQEAQAGALNSSRSGMAQGMAQQAAATAEGQADASIQNNAYNTGMSEAGSLYSSGLNTATNASMYGYNDLANNANTQAQQQIGLGEANATNQLSAANAGLGQNLNYETANANTQLNANAQLGNATTQGLQYQTTGLQNGINMYNLASAAGTLDQTTQQSNDTNAYDMWQNQNTYGQNILQNYMGIVGAPYGTQSVNQQQLQNPLNIPGNLAGGATAAYGLYNQINNNSQTSQNNAYNAGASPSEQIPSDFNTSAYNTATNNATNSGALFSSGDNFGSTF